MAGNGRLARDLLLRLDHGGLVAMGRGERGEAPPETRRAGDRAHRPVEAPPEQTGGQPELPLA